MGECPWTLQDTGGLPPCYGLSIHSMFITVCITQCHTDPHLVTMCHTVTQGAHIVTLCHNMSQCVSLSSEFPHYYSLGGMGLVTAVGAWSVLVCYCRQSPVTGTHGLVPIRLERFCFRTSLWSPPLEEAAPIETVGNESQ